jgi:hypothetical protein
VVVALVAVRRAAARREARAAGTVRAAGGKAVSGGGRGLAGGGGSAGGGAGGPPAMATPLMLLGMHTLVKVRVSAELGCPWSSVVGCGVPVQTRFASIRFTSH